MENTIRVKGRYNGITLESGNLLYQDIATAIIKDKQVKVDFSGQRYLAAPFLNAALGRLFGIFRTVVIIGDIDIITDTEEQFMLVHRVMINADAYYNKPGRKEAVDNAFAKFIEDME